MNFLERLLPRDAPVLAVRFVLAEALGPPRGLRPRRWAPPPTPEAASAAAKSVPPGAAPAPPSSP